MDKNKNFTVGDYLLKRLEQSGLKHIFGVPGDFVLKFFDQILESSVKLVTTCNELNGGYAADGYARINGIGALAVTYGAGALSATNAIAGAFAERVPVVVISGSPDIKYHKEGTLWHHTLGDYTIPAKIYEKITIASEFIGDTEKAPEQIDRAIKACLLHSRPVYLELPMDIAVSKCSPPGNILEIKGKPSDNASLEQAVKETFEMLSGSKRPIILAGMEIDRFGLRKEVMDFIEKSGYPFSSMLLGKTVLPEDHPQFIGLYQGKFTPDYIRADTILCIGALMTDANLGGFTANFKEDLLILANRYSVKIRDKIYENVSLKDYIAKLVSNISKGNAKDYDIKPPGFSYYDPGTRKFSPVNGKKLSLSSLYKRMAHFIGKDDIILAETGTSLFSTPLMIMQGKTKFIGQSFYGSIGYTLPATLGSCMAAPGRRVILFIGDGSFQLTCQELSTIIREKKTPIIILINNQGYTMERLIHDGSYNDIQPWKNHLLPEIFNGVRGMEIYTEDELEKALKKAEKSKEATIIEVHLGKWECSESLKSTLKLEKY
jgi:indolepyruvate decarboxylase